MCAAGALLSALLAGSAGSARADSIEDAMAKAYVSNPTLQAARFELRRTDETVPQSMVVYRPSVDFSVGGGYVDSSSSGNNANSTATNANGPAASYDLRVRQPVYRYRMGSPVDQAENTVKSGRAHLTAVEQSVLLNAASAYLEVARAQAVVNYAAEHERILDDQLASARRQFDAGVVRRSSVADAQAQQAAAAAQRSQAEGALAVARANYREVIGELPGAVTMPPLPGGLPGSLDEAIVETDNNPNIAVADFGEKAARNGVDVSLGKRLPQVFLQGEVQGSGESILGVVEVPIYNSALDPEVRAAKELVRQRRVELEQARRAARTSVVSAWENLQTAKSTQELYKAQIASAKVSAQETSREQQLGLRTLLDVLNLQSNLLTAQINLAGAEHDSRLAAYQLIAATGHLTAGELGLPVRTYDPKRHLQDVRGEWFGTGATLRAADQPALEGGPAAPSAVTTSETPQ